MNVRKTAILARFLKGKSFSQQLLRVFDPLLQQVLVRSRTEMLLEEHGKPGRREPGFFRHVAHIDRFRNVKSKIGLDPVQERLLREHAGLRAHVLLEERHDPFVGKLMRLHNSQVGLLLPAIDHADNQLPHLARMGGFEQKRDAKGIAIMQPRLHVSRVRRHIQLAGISDKAAFPIRVIEKIKMNVRVVRRGEPLDRMDVSGLKKTQVAFLQLMEPAVYFNFEQTLLREKNDVVEQVAFAQEEGWTDRIACDPDIGGEDVIVYFHWRTASSGCGFLIVFYIKKALNLQRNPNPFSL